MLYVEDAVYGNGHWSIKESLKNLRLEKNLEIKMDYVDNSNL